MKRGVVAQSGVVIEVKCVIPLGEPSRVLTSVRPDLLGPRCIPNSMINARTVEGDTRTYRDFIRTSYNTLRKV